MNHSIVLEAFENIADKNALAWSILDHKSENAVTSAIALTANRRIGRRVAHIEYRRVDLVLVENGTPTGFYQAKAAYTTDFQPSRLARCDWYLGACIDEDLVKLPNLGARVPLVLERAALFYLYEVSDTSRQLKYGRRDPVLIEEALAGLQGQVTAGKLVDRRAIDCGEADGAEVKIHLCVFEGNRGSAQQGYTTDALRSDADAPAI